VLIGLKIDMDCSYEDINFANNAEDSIYVNNIQQDSTCSKQPDLIQANHEQVRYVSTTLVKPSLTQQTAENLSPSKDWPIYEQTSTSNSFNVTASPPLTTSLPFEGNTDKSELKLFFVIYWNFAIFSNNN